MGLARETMFQPAAALAARLGLAWIFILEGAMKIGAYEAVAGYMQAYGVSPRLLPLVIATELGCGLLVAAGLFTRVAAFLLAGFCLMTALFFHRDFGDADQMVQLNKNIAIAGGFLGLVAFGAGRWSLDALRGRSRPAGAGGRV